MKRIIPYAFTGMLAIGLPASMSAGVIPQYKVSYENADEFLFLENPTKVKAIFSNHRLIFGDDNSHDEDAYTGEAFPIGFTFRLGGVDFTRFAIDNFGAIYLGTEKEGVVYRGQNTLMFYENLPREYDKADEFYLGMMIVGGIHPEFKSLNKEIKDWLKPEINYALLGEEGERVLVVEYRNMAPEHENPRKAGHYDLQIRLYEADNHFELAFNEVATPISNYYFNTGVRGFEYEDAMLLSATTIGAAPVVSESKVSTWDGYGSKIRWNGADDYDNEYKPVYSFYPETDTTAPANAPTELKIEQNGNEATVSVKKAEGSPATVLLYSESPLTDNDLPEDGVTFRSQGKFGDFVTTIGNATVLYYGDRDDIEVVLPQVEASKDYYFAALSVNGYPAFNKTNFAQAILSTAQPAPSKLTAIADGDVAKLAWVSPDPVIIAVTDECSHLQDSSYKGIFGQPAADAKVGDEIDGGGKVIYVGDGKDFEWTELPSNGMNYFGAWTVRDGRVSAVFADAHVCAPATLPYEARIEAYPSYVVPDCLSSNVRDALTLGVYNRSGDNSRSLRVVVNTGQPVEFYLPEIDFSGEDVEFSFDMAMETDRGVGMGEGGVELPLGNKAGEFGSGALEIKVRDASGTRVVETFKDYPGSMESNGDGGFVSGTSTFEPYKVELKNLGGKAQFGIKAETGEPSLLYIRNMKITRAGEAGVSEVIDAIPGVISGGNGEIILNSPVADTVNVYSIDGCHVASVYVEAGETVSIPVAKGLYIVKGVKVAVK